MKAIIENQRLELNVAFILLNYFRSHSLHLEWCCLQQIWAGDLIFLSLLKWKSDGTTFLLMLLPCSAESGLLMQRRQIQWVISSPCEPRAALQHNFPGTPGHWACLSLGSPSWDCSRQPHPINQMAHEITPIYLLKILLEALGSSGLSVKSDSERKDADSASQAKDVMHEPQSLHLNPSSQTALLRWMVSLDTRLKPLATKL